MTTEDLIDEARSHLRALERGEVVVGMPLTLRFMVSALEKEREDHDMTRRKLSAMIAVVDSRGEQIDTLRAKLTKAGEVLRPTLATLDNLGGCGDNSCCFVDHKGMGTNGGCRCLGRGGDNIPGMHGAVARVVRAARAALKAIGEGA